MEDEKMIFDYDDYGNIEEMMNAIIRNLTLENSSFQIKYKDTIYNLYAMFEHTATKHLSGYNIEGFQITGFEGNSEEVDLTFLKDYNWDKFSKEDANTTIMDYTFDNEAINKIEIDGNLITLDNGRNKIKLHKKQLDKINFHVYYKPCFEIKCASKSKQTLETLRQFKEKICSRSIALKNFPIAELRQAFQQDFARKNYICTFIDENIPIVSFDNETKQYASCEIANTRHSKKQFIDKFRQMIDKFKDLCIQEGKDVNWQYFDNILQKYCDTYFSLMNFSLQDSLHQNNTDNLTDKLKIVHLFLENNIELPNDSNIAHIYIDTELTSPSDIEKIMNISCENGTPPKCPIVFKYNGCEHTIYVNEEFNTKTNQFYRSINLIDEYKRTATRDFTLLSNAEIPNQHTITAFLYNHRLNYLRINSSMLSNTNIIGSFNKIYIEIDSKSMTRLLKDYEHFMEKNRGNFCGPDESVFIYGATTAQKLFFQVPIKKINKKIFYPRCIPRCMFIDGKEKEKENENKQQEKENSPNNKENTSKDTIIKDINNVITEITVKNLKEIATQLKDMQETSTPNERNELRDVFKEFLVASMMLDNIIKDAYDNTIEITDIDKLADDILSAYMQQDDTKEILEHEPGTSENIQYKPQKVLMLEEKPQKEEQPKEKSGTHFYAERANDILGKSYTKNEMLTLVAKDSMKWLPKASKVLKGDEDIAIAALKNNFMSYQLLDKQLFQKQSFQERLQKEIPAMHQMFKQAGMFNIEKQTEKQQEKTTRE